MQALISQRESVDQYNVGIDVLESTYVSFFERIGILLRPVSNFHQKIESIFDELTYDFIILTGGGSIEPKYYDITHSDKLQPNRDKIEKTLLSEAIKRQIPILAICRGMQLVNGLYGGLVSRMESLPVPRPIGVDHPIILGSETCTVNNYHNIGIYSRHLSTDLEMIAVDLENNVVEGFYHEFDKILGIQWHPERKFKTEEAYLISKNLIQNFIENRGILDERYHFSSWTGNET